jgi:hypothetical protein
MLWIVGGRSVRKSGEIFLDAVRAAPLWRFFMLAIQTDDNNPTSITYENEPHINSTSGFGREFRRGTT